MEEISYLRARDPSIVLLSYNRTGLAAVKRKLDSDMANSLDSLQSESDEDKYINVYLRIKGDAEVNEDIYEVVGDTLICNVPETSYNLRNVKSGSQMKKTYSFTSIFGPDTTQKVIFNYIVKPKLLSFINARNSTLFTYGASGSGKTFTIVGTPEEPGLIPRALEYIFRSIPKLKEVPQVKPLSNGDTTELNELTISDLDQKKSYIVNATLLDQSANTKTYKEMQERLSSEPVAEVEEDSDVSVSVWVSFSEIYNEIVYDLLIPPAARGKQRPRLALGKTKDENTYIKNLTLINVSDGLEAYQILQYGLHNLNYAATAVNSHSSRSHCIFTIKLVQSSKHNSDIYVSNFNFCDLAGSERLKKTGNLGDRLKESNNINTSLLVLGRCMENIRKYQQTKDNRLIPFRESKLTQIFQRALMGHERVNMIVNINPSREMFDETIHVLNFSAIAKTVAVEEKEPKVMRKKTRFTLLVEAAHPLECPSNQYLRVEDIEIRKLRMENQRLRKELETKTEKRDDDEINELESLRDAVEQLTDERNELIAYYEKKIVDDKEFVANIYKESIARREKFYKDEKEKALQKLRTEYESKLAETQVITITSSSSEDEDEDESPVKKMKRTSRKELLERIQELEQKVMFLEEALEDKEKLIEEAKEEYLYFRTENEKYRQAYEEAVKENMKISKCENITFNGDSF